MHGDLPIFTGEDVARAWDDGFRAGQRAARSETSAHPDVAANVPPPPPRMNRAQRRAAEKRERRNRV